MTLMERRPEELQQPALASKHVQQLPFKSSGISSASRQRQADGIRDAISLSSHNEQAVWLFHQRLDKPGQKSSGFAWSPKFSSR